MLRCLATKWYKRSRSFFPVEIHVNHNLATHDIRVTLSTLGTDSADWLDVEMDYKEAAELVRCLQELLRT